MSNAVMTASTEPTMSSREIAELTGKRHFHVKTDIEKMLTELQEDITRFRGIYFDSMNREQVEFHLDRDLTDCLLTGYSAKARMAVITITPTVEPTPGGGSGLSQSVSGRCGDRWSWPAA